MILRRFGSYKVNIEGETVKNTFYRKVLCTVPGKMQLVMMNLRPTEEIGMEIHHHTSQFFRIESGTGIAIVGNKKYRLKDGDCVIVPPGTRHNIINTSKENELKLYTIYSPPEHEPGEKEKYRKEH